MAIDERQLYRYIGQQLRDRRITLQLTQHQVAREIGVERTSITNIESGHQKLPLSMLYELCDLLGMDVHMVLPAVGDIRATVEEEVIRIDGRATRVPSRTASFVRTMLEDRKQDS